MTRPTRFACYGYAALAVLFAPLVAAALVYVVLAFVLCLVWVGVYLVPSAFAFASWTTGRYRCLAAAILRRPVEAHYRPTAGLPPWRRVQALVTDEARWRDVGWFQIFALVTWTIPAAVLVWPWWTLTIWPVWANAHGRDWYASGVGFVLACIFTVPWVLLLRPAVRLMARIDAAVLGDNTTRLRHELARSQAARADQLDVSAAELRRLERDLHDGPQARLASLGMTLGLAAELADRDPSATKALLEEARAASGAALADIRSVVRGIHPPVLADRGLGGAIQALAVDLPIPVSVIDDLPARLPAPVESAVYFAVAESLANVVKHAQATSARVHLAGAVTAVVADDGRGGAAVTDGGGLAGVARRLAAFDGTLVVVSPASGGTKVTLEVPCALWWGRTTSS